ncbi:hypothetical protein SBDP1_30029 [Syntrophobacter sp. SbD1]|nr:hypothetical protein SBDP1_30029 [Syntrophobacter sp. SbD1]
MYNRTEDVSRDSSESLVTTVPVWGSDHAKAGLLKERIVLIGYSSVLKCGQRAQNSAFNSEVTRRVDHPGRLRR